jgi:hypothetical protein
MALKGMFVARGRGVFQDFQKIVFKKVLKTPKRALKSKKS